MKKTLAIAAAGLLVLGSLAGCTNQQSETTTTASTEATDATDTSDANTAELQKLVVGASPAPHAEILEAAREELKERGYDLEVKEYTDYVQPNLALSSGDLDANYFQHHPYLDQFNEENGTTLVSAGAIHYEPFGIYAGKTKSIEELADGARIAVPNDATNEARALLLLEEQGLITLKEGVGLKATKTDIVENSKNLEIFEVEAAQLPRSLQDVELAVINGNYAIEAGLNVADALAIEDAESLAAVTYGNVIAVRDGEGNSDAIHALFDALTSESVKSFITERYQGAVVPLY